MRYASFVTALVAVASMAAAVAPATMPSRAFRPGEVWNDASGAPIQAHGGGILKAGSIYYWYGEDKTLGDHNRTGVACYSSRDLYVWKREGVVLPKDAVPAEFRDNGICERPKVIYCRRTRKYVMWMHLDDARYHLASAGVAVSDRPTGPFTFLRRIRPITEDIGYPNDEPTRQKQDGGTYRDMNLFVDDDGAAYAFYASENNATMYVVRLNADYTGPQQPAVRGKTWARILVGKFREAPAPFKYRGRYYLITSACTGWAPNAAGYATAPNPLGPWEEHGNPCAGPGAETTYNSQSTYVLPMPDMPAGCFIFMADRWNSRNLEDSRYVWLPFKVRADGSFALEWLERWDLGWFSRP